MRAVVSLNNNNNNNNNKPTYMEQTMFKTLLYISCSQPQVATQMRVAGALT
jgi:hypothetical protein